MTQLPNDFREFLKLLDAANVEYLLVGGYAVGQYGYPRATADIDIWMAVNPANAEKMVEVLREFGFGTPDLTPETFLRPGQMVRMGTPPLRIEILTEVSGVSFEECISRRIVREIDGVPVSIIGLDDLKANKRAAGRYKDLDDVEHL